MAGFGLPNGSFRLAKRPISRCETNRLAVQNGLFRNAKQAVLKIHANMLANNGGNACLPWQPRYLVRENFMLTPKSCVVVG